MLGAREGDLYSFHVDGNGPFPDPASRFQPRGPHGPSQLIDPSKFDWNDESWHGINREGQVIYEMHVGTFTPEGTWQAAARQLPALAELGITVLEIMPVADFAGEFGWGYDGVDLFAVTRNYGTPDDFRMFVDVAHRNKIGVILDVVYNHVGPEGNYLPHFSEHYFAKDLKTDWGQAINFYGEHSGPVREFYLSNAAFWIKEYHLDGLRIDATQNIYDKSKDHILAAICRAARKAADGRNIILIGENEPQQVKLIRPESEGGYEMDALWNDDFHHSAMVAATGKKTPTTTTIWDLRRNCCPRRSTAFCIKANGIPGKKSDAAHRFLAPSQPPWSSFYKITIRLPTPRVVCEYII